MDPREQASANDRIGEVLRAEPPVEGATLAGWVAFSEWKTPEGESRLILLGKPEENMTQLRATCTAGS
jgi:hypothetical protein